jgi:hypothetical protein
MKTTMGLLILIGIMHVIKLSLGNRMAQQYGDFLLQP